MKYAAPTSCNHTLLVMSVKNDCLLAIKNTSQQLLCTFRLPLVLGDSSQLKSESRLSVTVDDPTLVVAESGLLTKKAYEYIILQKSSLPQTNKQNHTEQYGDLHCSNYKQENDS